MWDGDVDLDSATRDQLVEHILTQRKLIAHLYARLREATTATMRGTNPHTTNPPLSSSQPVPSPPPAPHPSFSPLPLSSPRPAGFPSHHPLVAPQGGGGGAASTTVVPRLQEELSNIELALERHFTNIEPLRPDVVGHLCSMRTRLAQAVRDALEPTNDLRDVSVITAVRDKATLEDVLECSRWMESPGNSRTPTPLVMGSPVIRPQNNREMPVPSALPSGWGYPPQHKGGSDPFLSSLYHAPSMMLPTTTTTGGGRATLPSPPRSLVQRLQSQLGSPVGRRTDVSTPTSRVQLYRRSRQSKPSQ